MEETIIYFNINTKQSAVFASNATVDDIYSILAAGYPEDNIEDWVVKNPAISAMADTWIGTLLDSAAKSIGYESAITAITFTNSKIAKYAEEARYILNYRDALWSKYETLDPMTEMSEDEFIQLMPSFKTFLPEPPALAPAEDEVSSAS